MKQTKRFLALFLSLLLLFSVSMPVVSAQAPYQEGEIAGTIGDGTPENPIQVDTYAEFKNALEYRQDLSILITDSIYQSFYPNREGYGHYQIQVQNKKHVDFAQHAVTLCIQVASRYLTGFSMLKSDKNLTLENGKLYFENHDSMGDVYQNAGAAVEASGGVLTIRHMAIDAKGSHCVKGTNAKITIDHSTLSADYCHVLQIDCFTDQGPFLHCTDSFFAISVLENLDVAGAGAMFLRMKPENMDFRRVHLRGSLILYQHFLLDELNTNYVKMYGAKDVDTLPAKAINSQYVIRGIPGQQDPSIYLDKKVASKITTIGCTATKQGVPVQQATTGEEIFLSHRVADETKETFVGYQFMPNIVDQITDGFIMPSAPVTVTAVFKPTYKIEIINGHAEKDGKLRKYAAEGERLQLVANQAPKGKVFIGWKSDDVRVDSENTYLQPAKTVRIEAQYVDLVDSIQVTIPALTVGAPYFKTASLPSQVPYHLEEDLQWWVGNSSYPNDSAKAFYRPNRSYTVYCYVRFDHLASVQPNMQAFVNGNKAELTMRSDDLAQIAYTFPALEGKEIESILIDAPKVEVGRTIQETALTSQEPTDYTVSLEKVCPEGSDVPLAADTQFENATAYRFYLTTEFQKSNIIFGESVSCNVQNHSVYPLQQDKNGFYFEMPLFKKNYDHISLTIPKERLQFSVGDSVEATPWQDIEKKNAPIESYTFQWYRYNAEADTWELQPTGTLTEGRWKCQVSLQMENPLGNEISAGSFLYLNDILFAYGNATSKGTLWTAESDEIYIGENKDYVLYIEPDTALNPNQCAQIKQYLGTESHVSIPQYMGGHFITGTERWSGDWVDTGAFGNNATIEEVEFPMTFARIDDESFMDCPNLSVLNFTHAYALESIGANAFCNCKALKAVTLPENLKRIFSFAFDGTMITCITLPKYVEDVSPQAFINTPLEKYIVGENDTYYTVEGMLYSMESGATLVSCPPNLQRRVGNKMMLSYNFFNIGAYAFSGLQMVEHLYLDGRIDTIKSNAFSGCPDLRSIHLSNTLTVLPEHLVERCPNFLYMRIPTSVTTIEGKLFGNNTGTAVALIEKGSAVDTPEMREKAFGTRYRYIGDLTGDGIVNLSDYNAMVNSVCGTTSLSITDRACADIDDDGAVDAFDIALCHQLLAS